MASEFAIGGCTTGSTVVAIVRRDSDEAVWDGSSFVTWDDSDFAAGDYDTVLTEQGTSGYFVGNFPSDIDTAGAYNLTYYTRTGVSGPYTHQYETTVGLDWDGSSTVGTISGLNWVSASDYKTLYQVTDSSLDAVLDLLIPLTSAALNTYLGRTIKATDLVKVYRGNGLPIMNLREWPINSLTTVTIDYLDNGPTAIDGDEFYTDTVGQLRFKPSSHLTQCFSSQLVKVEMNAGYSSVPGDLQLACLMRLHELVQTADPDVLVTEKSVKDVKVKYDLTSMGVMGEDIKMILNAHMMPVLI